MAVTDINCWLPETMSKYKLCKALTAFTLTFILGFTYFSFSDFTSWITSLWASFLLSLICTVGLSCSVYLRCAALLFIPQCFSHLGLFLQFVFFSWITMQKSIGAFLYNHQVAFKEIGATLSTEKQLFEDSGIQFVMDLLGILHYGVIVPYICIYVYAVLYEITYETRRSITRSGKKQKKGKSYVACITFVKHVMSFFIGLIFSATIIFFLTQNLSYRYLLGRYKVSHLDTTELKNLSSGWLFNLSTSTILLIFAPFSKIVNKLRHKILEQFFNITSTEVKVKGKHIFVRKAMEKRVTYKAYKQHRKDQSEAEKSGKYDNVIELEIIGESCRTDSANSAKQNHDFVIPGTSNKSKHDISLDHETLKSKAQEIFHENETSSSGSSYDSEIADNSDD